MLEYVSTAAKTIRLTTALKPLLPFVFPALNQSALAMTTSQQPLLVTFIDNKCDSRRTAWEWWSAFHPKVHNVPLSTKFALLNPRSTRSKSSIILDTILSLKLDIIALTETCISKNAYNVTKYEIVPHGFHVLHSNWPIGKRGGGISVISRNSIRLDAIKSPSHFSFESLTASVFSSHCLFLSVIYCPSNTGNFICKLTSHLYFLYSLSSNFILAGDFNTPNCTSHDNSLSGLLRELELVQHIDFPTHRLGNILTSSLLQNLTVISYKKSAEELLTPITLILCSLNLAPPPLPPRIVISRSFENYDDAVFEKDLRHMHNTLTNLSDVPVEEFLTTMNNSFQSLIDHHAPFRTHIFHSSSHSHRKLSTDAIAAKRKRRKLERKISLLLRSSKPVPASLLAALKESRKTARALIFKSRADYFKNMLVKPNSKIFWKTANSILHGTPPSPPRSSSEAINLVNTFSSFFKEKIALIHKFLPTSILRCTDPILPDNRTPLLFFICQYWRSE